MSDEQTYKIVRHCFDQNSDENGRVIGSGLTLDEAKAHCNDPETRGDGWFDGFTAE